jgi:lipopolysaccharide export system permease protein
MENLLFNYVVRKIIFSVSFFVIICVTLGEFIGISFEQIRFISDSKISITTSILIHALAFPKFLVITLPYAFLMANIFTYRELSRTSEIIALRSIGICTTKIVSPSIILSLLITVNIFLFQDIITTKSNYIAATILEKAVGVSRIKIEKDNFSYIEFDKIHHEKHIRLLLYSRKASAEIMKDITLITFDRESLDKIIMARLAYWNSKENIWILHQGVEEKIDKNRHLTSNKFEIYNLRLGHTLNQMLTQARDNDELNIYELRRKLNIFKETGHEKEVNQLETIIQGRFVTPFSCFVFSLVGASIGINLKPRSVGNEFSLGLIIILTYYTLQAIDTTLITKEVIPMWGIWIPSFSGIGFAFLRLARFS